MSIKIPLLNEAKTSLETESSMPRVHKNLQRGRSEALKITSMPSRSDKFKQPHYSRNLNKCNVIDQYNYNYIIHVYLIRDTVNFMEYNASSTISDTGGCLASL